MAGVIRPCVHCAATAYHTVWGVEADGTPYTEGQQVCRAIVRYLKGHGTDYALDGPTWAHYRRVGLTAGQMFKVLRPFHQDSAALKVGVM